MRSFRNLLIAVGLALASQPAMAAHTRVELILNADTAEAGNTAMAGIHLHMDPEWHTYWKNSGASGIPTTVKWTLPPGITAGEILWPVPEKLPPDDLTTYIYEGDVVLLVPLFLAKDLPAGPHELKAAVSWLECKEQCVPGKAEVTATLNIGTVSKPSPDRELIQQWQKQLPQSGKDLSAQVWWGETTNETVRSITFEWKPLQPAGEADFYPQSSDDFEVQGATERLPSEAGTIRLRKLVKKLQGDWPKEISGLLIQKSVGQKLGYQVTLPVSAAAGHESAAAITAPSSAKGNDSGTSLPSAVFSQPLWKMLLYAFIGGLILNVMPCVLPVIALKILGFVGEARNDPRHVRTLGLVYALGVLVSFLVLAGLVIAVKAAGHRAAWGMQFNNPQFVVVLIVLVTLVALNLFGVFEVNLSSRVLNPAGTLASKHGTAGAFFNGALATVLATPCTAPILGQAIGFAFAQAASVIVLIFLTVGLGLALPYVILSWQPAWLKFLPKPGLWMEKFKMAMGFPILATAIWLLSLTPSYYGRRSWWLGIFLVIMAFAGWVYGEFFQRGRSRRGLALVITLVLLGTGYAYAIEGQLNWRQPIPPETSAGLVKEGADGIAWEHWNARAVEHAQEEGHPALVDFTADWCLTCQVNKQVALEIPTVRAKLKEMGAATFLGDYTRFPDNITTELNRYGRAGVPLVLVYPPKAGAPPIVLPELLTPGIVLQALDQAVKQ